MSLFFKLFIVTYLHGQFLGPFVHASPLYQIEEIIWTDADSGFIDGQSFRIRDIDAPEISRKRKDGSERCSTELILANIALKTVRDLTRKADSKMKVEIAYTDRYGRAVIILYLDGNDIRDELLELGLYKLWPHRNGKSLSPKPNWCTS